jgi:hypothetical protein
LNPPHTKFDDSWDVNPPKSPRSITATDAPRPANTAADTAPLIPPPTITTSKAPPSRRSRLVVRSVIGPRRYPDRIEHVSPGHRRPGTWCAPGQDRWWWSSADAPGDRSPLGVGVEGERAARGPSGPPPKATRAGDINTSRRRLDTNSRTSLQTATSPVTVTSRARRPIGATLRTTRQARRP